MCRQSRTAGERITGFLLRCWVVLVFAVAPVLAAESEESQMAFFEFLGSWMMEDTGEDWLDFLGSLAGGESGAGAKADEPVLQGETHEQE